MPYRIRVGCGLDAGHPTTSCAVSSPVHRLAPCPRTAKRRGYSPIRTPVQSLVSQADSARPYPCPNPLCAARKRSGLPGRQPSRRCVAGSPIGRNQLSPMRNHSDCLRFVGGKGPVSRRHGDIATKGAGRETTQPTPRSHPHDRVSPAQTMNANSSSVPHFFLAAGAENE